MKHAATIILLFIYSLAIAQENYTAINSYAISNIESQHTQGSDWVLDSTHISYKKNTNNYYLKFRYKTIERYENGLDRVIVSENKDTINNLWKNSFKTVYFYSIDYVLDSIINYHWNTYNNTFVPDSKQIIILDDYGREHKRLRFSYQEATKEWRNQFMFTNNYEGGLLTTTTMEFWDQNLMEWEVVQKFTTNYNDHGNIDTIKYFRLTNGFWNKFGYHYYEYDTDNLQKSKSIWYWNTIDQSYAKTSIYTYKYDSNKNRSTEDLKKFDADLGYFLNYSLKNYYWSSFVPNAIVDSPKPIIELFPNPVINELTISNYKIFNGTSIRIYNLKGEIQLQSTLKKYIDVSQLPNDTYILQIIEKNKIYNQKFIKL